jgi:hypothetical protein
MTLLRRDTGCRGPSVNPISAVPSAAWSMTVSVSAESGLAPILIPSIAVIGLAM